MKQICFVNALLAVADIGEVVHATWDCTAGTLAVIGTDTTGEPTDLQACVQACNGTPTCLAVYWRRSDNNCHLLEGSFTKSQWEASQFPAGGSSDSEYVFCFRSESTAGSCSAADTAAIYKMTGGDICDAVDKCGHTARWPYVVGISPDKFNGCLTAVAGIGAACSECYAAVADYGLKNCKAACLHGWCTYGCNECTRPAQIVMKACTGIQAAKAQDQVVSLGSMAMGNGAGEVVHAISVLGETSGETVQDPSMTFTVLGETSGETVQV